MTTKQQETGKSCTASVADGGRGHEPRHARDAALEAGKGKETDSAPERAWP